MIVRLKATESALRGGSLSLFQFYDSPIKSPEEIDGTIIVLSFQFYDSPIKRANPEYNIPYGPGFNSMIVRLKDPRKVYLRMD